MQVGLIWIGYGIAVAGIAFGTGNGNSAAAVGIVGAVMAAIATAFVAVNK